MSAKIITGLSFEEYTQIEAVNFSTLKLMAVSPLHYKNAVENGGVRRPAFALGNAAHTAILEPREWMRRYTLKPQDIPRRDRRIKAWAEFEDAAKAAGKEILTEAEYDLATDISQSVMLSRSAAELLRGKTSREISITWTHPATGLVLRSRLDLVSHGRAVCDIKTAQSVVPREFFRSATQYHYPEQFALYSDAYTAATGDELPFKIIVVEKSKPHDVVVVNVPEEVLEYGRTKYEDWLEQVARCRDSGVWPGIGGETGEIDFRLPYWAANETEVEAFELSVGGEKVAL